MVELSVVLPVYNEEDAILPVLDELVAFKEEFERRHASDALEVEIIVVDDGSTDQTPSRLASSAHPKTVLSQPNQGYGAALKRGFAAAKGRWVGFLDADGTYPAEAFFSMYQQTAHMSADLVIGCRLDEPSGMPGIRSVGNRAFSKLLGITSNSRVRDIASGMRLLRRDRVAELVALPDGLDFTPAMSTWALHDGWEVKEVPISYRERIGASKLHVFKDGLRFAYHILSISALYNPLKLFGAAGLVLSTVALALVIQPLIVYIQIRRVPETSIYRLLTALLFWALGLQSMACGVVGASMARILHRKPLRESRFERFVLRPSITGRLHWLALAFVVAALALNGRAIIEYLTLGTISEHWSRVLAGIVLVLTSFQMLLFEFLVRYLRALDNRFTHRQ